METGTKTLEPTQTVGSNNLNGVNENKDFKVKQGNLGGGSTNEVPHVKPVLQEPISQVFIKEPVEESIPEVSSSDTVTEEIVSSEYGYHMGQKVRIGSRIVRIEQTKQFSLLPTDPKAQQIRDEVVKRISCQFKRGSKDVIRGLSYEEELKYLPRILGLKPDHDTWETRVKDFWLNFNISIQAGMPVELEAGFRFKYGSTTEAEPIDIDGYMKYNFAKENSNVGDADNDLTHLSFKMIDTAEQRVRDEEVFSARKVTDRLFNQIIADSDKFPDVRLKIDWILETYGGKHVQVKQLDMVRLL
jgi:hypothetical protein